MVEAADRNGQAGKRPAQAFAHVADWIFDLDNTLYPAESDLFKQIDQRMTAFLQQLLGVSQEEAFKVQKDYYHRYGTTLKGLMGEHQVDPHVFMDFVHDIDLSVIGPDPVLAAHLRQLPGKRFIFTNGSVKHAERITEHLGLGGLFDDIFDIAAAAFEPKPLAPTYDRMVAATGADPRAAAMFEDMATNLVAAHALGMQTVWVRAKGTYSQSEAAREGSILKVESHDHIHHVTDDLRGFLGEVVASLGLEADESAAR